MTRETAADQATRGTTNIMAGSDLGIATSDGDVNGMLKHSFGSEYERGLS